MKNEKPLEKNILYSGAAAVSNVLLVALVIVAARVLGAKSFGNFSTALAIASVFETVIDLGMNTLTVREISRDRDASEQYLSNIMGWKLVLSALAMAMLALTVNILHESIEVRYATYMLGGAVVIRSYKGTSHAFFQSQERFDLLLLTTYVERVLTLAAGLTAILMTHSLLVFAAAFTLIRIPDLLFSFWLVHRQITPVHFSFKPEMIKRIQKAALPFGSYAVVGVMYSYVGTIVLSAMTNPAHVGWYSAAYKIYEGLTMFPYIICAVLLPRLSRLFAEDIDRHRKLVVGALRYIMLFSLPLLISVSILASQAVVILYGRAYVHAVPILRILLAAATLMFVNSILSTVLVSANGEKIVLRANCISLLVMTAANLILVRRMGVNGAAFAVLISETSVLLLYAASVRRLLFRLPVERITWRPVVACLSGGAILHFSRPYPPAVLVIIFASIYITVLFTLRAFDRNDVAMLKRLLLPSARDTG